MSRDSLLSVPTPMEPGPDSPSPSVRLLAVPLAVLSLVLGVAAGYLAQGPLALGALAIPLMALPILLWHRPHFGLYIIFAAAVTIEQFPYWIASNSIGIRGGAVTSQIPVFRGFGGVLSPIDLLMALLLVIVVMKAVQRREPVLSPSVVLSWLVAFSALVVGYTVIGLGRGGNFHWALTEIRPFFYILFVYVLATSLVRSMSVVRNLLWILVLGCGAKAVYGLVIFAGIRGVQPRPEAILAHEESFFFGLFIFLTVALWLFGVRGRLRWVATALLPAVLLADMANSRRTAWLILFVGLTVLAIIAFTRYPRRRKQMGVVLTILALGTAMYLPAFWSQNGTLAQPARAIRSEVAPDPRDEASNSYRDIESYNLQVFISQRHSTGLGYGTRLDYVGLVDLSEEVPMLAYVPHNSVMGLWARQGILGITVFCIFLAQATITAVRLTRSRSREVASLGALAAATIITFAAMGYTDLGFFWSRNAIVLGMVLGAVDAMARGYRSPSADRMSAPGVGADNPISSLIRAES